MANTTINGVAVIRGTIWMELVGVWLADLEIDQPDGTGFDAGTKVTIQTANLSLSGTVVPNRTGDFLDTVHVRIKGGGAGMAKQATARSFVQPGAYARDIINALCSNGGETLSSSADATFLASNLTAWSIMTGTVTQGLRALLDVKAPTFNWRILSDGTLWMGTETWPSSSQTFDILDQDPKENSYELGVESPWIVPGVNVSGVGNVNKVVHHIEHSKIRSHVLVDIPGEERGAGADVAGIVAQEMAALDYSSLYECQVVVQSSDLSTVDVKPTTSTKFAGLQRVRLRHGLPGCKVQVAPGAKVLLGWMGGDPSQPYACLWDGTETALSVQLAGTHPAPLFDKFQADLNALLGVIAVIIASSTATGPLLGLSAPYAGPPHVPPFATNADALPALVLSLSVAASYQSQIVSNG